MAQTNLSGPLVVTDYVQAGSIVTTGGTITGNNAVFAGTATAATVKWATAGATGGTADSASLRGAVVTAITTLSWGTATATGGTAAAGGLTQGGYLKSGGGTVYWATRLQKYAAASAGWNDGTVYNPGDIIWNGAPAAGSAVGWICRTLGTGTGAVFTGFGSIGPG